MKILVVDCQRSVAEALAGLGHSVALLNHGSQALQCLQDSPYHLILLDLDSSEGMLSLAQIRRSQQQGLAGAPLVAMVSEGNPQNIELAHHGLRGIVSKSLSPDELEQLLKIGCEVECRLDQAQLVDLLSIEPDGAFLSEMAQLFSERGRELLAEIQNALQQRDLSNLLEAIHELKGASMTIGAHFLARACMAIEDCSYPSRQQVLAVHWEFCLAQDDIWTVVRSQCART